MTTVRVVIPTYNRRSVLDDALRSVMAQTVRENDVAIDTIVVDDGSADDTVAWLRSSSHACQILSQHNMGAAAARNAAIRSAGHFDFVAFLDSDDLWLPSHLEDTLMAFAAHDTADVVFGHYRVVDAVGRWPPSRLAERDRRIRLPLQYSRGLQPAPSAFLPALTALDAMLGGHFYPYTSTVAVRRRALVPDGPWFSEELRIMEDADFYIRLALNGSDFVYLDATQATIRYHGDNLTGQTDLSSPMVLASSAALVHFARNKVAYASTARRDSAPAIKELADALYLLGQCESERGNYTVARKCYREALGLSGSLYVLKSYVGATYRGLRSGRPCVGPAE